MYVLWLLFVNQVYTINKMVIFLFIIVLFILHDLYHTLVLLSILL
jgi:hypothetical protein